MLFINDSKRVMFYQDDLVVSYKDFLLITKYFEEQVFRDIDFKKVAIVLPDGLTEACLLVYCLQKYTVLPLTTNYLAPEYESILKDFTADLVIVCESDESDAIQKACAVSNTRILAIADLTHKLDEIRITYHDTPVNLDFFSLNQGELVLFTSGTTGKPKQVCLNWTNMLASVANIRNSYNLTPTDVCLNVMPLYHIHGIIACLLSSIYSGGSVILLKNGFDAIKFFDQLFTLCPSWYSAVPTIHQSICNRILSKYAGNIQHKLRFIRSSSSALPGKVYNDLVKLFKTPVYQAYGMTEACHQISTQLVTRNSANGSVGFGVNVLIKIRDDTGKDQAENSEGIVWIKGANLFEHYKDISKEASGFSHDGYFNTGDIGYLDSEGALTIVSRLKEMINKAGEKIAPKEIEDVILTHPLVDNAVCFSIDDSYYGENVGLAITPVENGKLGGETVIEYLSKFLNEFKQPQEIYFVNELPKGKTGKLQRIGLSQRLKDMGLMPYRSSHVSGGSAMHNDDQLIESITHIWQTILQMSPIKADDDYFILGGNSILAIKLVSELNKHVTMNKQLSVADIFKCKTIKQLSNYINYEYYNTHRLVKLMNDNNSSQLLFMIHPGMVGCEVYFSLANELASLYKCYGIDNYNIHNREQITKLYDLASLYLSYIEEVRLQNKVETGAAYNLSGWSMGALLALAIASLLEARGVSNINVICIDANLNDGDEKIADMRARVISNHREELHRRAREIYPDEDYLKNVIVAMDSEKSIGVELIGRKLATSRILLFKAIQLDEHSLGAEDMLEFNNYLLQLPSNNLNNILVNKEQLKIIPLEAHHFNVMDRFNQIADEIGLLSQSNFFNN